MRAHTRVHAHTLTHADSHARDRTHTYTGSCSCAARRHAQPRAPILDLNCSRPPSPLLCAASLSYVSLLSDFLSNLQVGAAPSDFCEMAP
eukprot:6208878-Pleurochrysis_carterae.AAC.2